MNAKLTLGTTLALLALTASAFGQTPARLMPAPGSTAETGLRGLADPTPRQIPRGVPGFYDPSTRMFTPLEQDSAASGGLFGDARVEAIHTIYNKDLKKDFVKGFEDSGDRDAFFDFLAKSLGRSNTSLAGIRTLEGFQAAAPFSYSIQKPVNTVSRHFVFTPQGTDPVVQPVVTSQVRASNGVTYRTTITLPAKPATSGTLTWKFDVNL